MATNPSAIVPSESLNRRILDYVLAMTERRGFWSATVSGTELSRRDELTEYRLRMEGRRSVADLYHDVKSEPFDGASNVGIGIEMIFAESLIPLLLANTHDLEPMLQATFKGTKKVHDDLTTFHDTYHRFEVPEKRELLEASTRELLTTGSAFHKWTYGRLWRQSQVDFPVWTHPLSGQPILTQDPGTGQMLPKPADPSTPKEAWPLDPATRMPLTLDTLKAVKPLLIREGPELCVRPVEAILFPLGETRPDPNRWDWVAEDFEVSAYWLLGRQQDAMHGAMDVTLLWRWLGIDPNALYADPIKLASSLKPVKLRAFHGKYPATADGTPIEIVALIATEAKVCLGWQPSPCPRRPYFNRQVWGSGTSPIGKGIPETVFAMRSAMDALLNQELDAGNLDNHPPLLLSDLAMLEDEEYETTGPGATWIMRDVNGAKFLPTTLHRRDPVSLLDWLISNTMRIWGVTDLMLNAPSQSLSPNVKTAHGTQAILNQGSIKFGHLTKRLTATETLEYQYVHDVFRIMLANARRVTQGGKPMQLDPTKREEYFAEDIQLAAVGNGISTNPILRQRTYSEFVSAAAGMQNPFLIRDLEAYKQLTDQWVAAYGIDVTTKEPQALQQSRLFLELMQTPEGQQAIPAVMQQVIQSLQLAQQNNGRPHARPLVPVQ